MVKLNIEFSLPSVADISSVLSGAKDLAYQSLPAAGQAVSGVVNLGKNYLGLSAPSTLDKISDVFTWARDSVMPAAPTYRQQAWNIGSKILTSQTGLSYLGHGVTLGEAAVLTMTVYIAGKYVIIPVVNRWMGQGAQKPSPAPLPEATEPPATPSPKKSSENGSSERSVTGSLQPPQTEPLVIDWTLQGLDTWRKEHPTKGTRVDQVNFLPLLKKWADSEEASKGR